MLEPEYPRNEPARLAALGQLRLLDTQPEQRFDRITRTAQRLFDVPIVLISLVDSERQWFKSRQGLDAQETPRSISFCGHAILGEGAFIVRDAAADRRFADNPLVTGSPYIRFYGGIPLRGPDGHKVGTLCIIDRKPRTFSDADIAALCDLSAWAESEINTYSLAQATAIARESEARLRSIVEHVVDGIITFDAQGVIESVNAAVLQMIGCDRKRIVGRDIRQIVRPVPVDGDDTGSGSWYGIALEDVINPASALIGYRSDGSTFRVDFATSVMHLEGRRLLTGILRDRSMRDRTEIALVALKSTVRSQSEALLRAEAIQHALERRVLFIANHMPAMIAYWGQDERCQFANKIYKEWFGMEPEQLLGKTLREMQGDQLYALNEPYIRGALRGEPQLFDRTLVDIFGVTRYTQANYTPDIQDGEVRGFFVLVTDITEHRRAEEAVRELNRKLAATTALQKTILNSTNYAIISTDLDGVIQLFNAGAQRMFGYAAHELVGKQTPFILHDPEEIAARARQLSVELGRPIAPGDDVFTAKAKAGMVDEHEWTYIHRNGRRFPALLSLTALRDEDGTMSGYVGIVYDLTERKKIEQMKNEFISTVSHELRTPLTSIRGSLGLLASGAVGQIHGNAQELLDIAKNNCERLVRMINDILDIEKIESHHLRFNAVLQRILPLAEQAIATTQEYAAQYHVRFELRQEAGDAQVMVDGDRIIQVMINLLSNAAKFSPAGAPVEIRLLRLPGGVRFSVRDHGPGIDEEFRSRIFQKFAQADSSTTRKKGGSGLGLSISRAIVEKHHGRIDFACMPEGGVEFYFDLPLGAPIMEESER